MTDPQEWDARSILRLIRQTAVEGGKKIEAIKYWRMLTGDGLRESKDAVEALMALGATTLNDTGVTFRFIATANGEPFIHWAQRQAGAYAIRDHDNPMHYMIVRYGQTVARDIASPRDASLIVEALNG